MKIQPVEARLELFDDEHRKSVETGDVATLFTLDVCHTGTTILNASFIDETGETQGAYYVDIERLDEDQDI